MASYIGPCWEAVFVLRRSLLAVVERDLKRVYGQDGWWGRVASRFDTKRQAQLKELFESRRKNALAPMKGEEKELLDISDLYQVIEGEWSKVFKSTWNKSPLNWLKEIVDVRNPLAHPTSLGIERETAVRLLQNCRYVLEPVDSEAADEVKSIEARLDRVEAEVGLPPWYAVATPHEDIREGRLDESVFAANLWAVVQGTAPEVYLDAEEFLRKSYMTDGLRRTLQRVTKALAGGVDAGDRSISLQTGFGGGKTHTLVALWHVARHGPRLAKSPWAESLRQLVGQGVLEQERAVAVFTNATCDPTQGRVTPQGIHTRSAWGELALQLGGPSLYQKVKANDEARSAPKGLFVEVLRAAAPCLILLDELADYCVAAAGVEVAGTTLADQTISFIQELTEAVQQVPGTVVVATLPASKYEVAQSEKGQEAFTTLEKRFQRLGADIKPVADEEIYEVVRARLFESVAPSGDRERPRRVAEAYQRFYADHKGEVPAEASKTTTYREQLERSYPFHPSLIDALYHRWGSHPDFQRTRGVLRLLASIVGDLWQRRNAATETQHLIQACGVNWALDPLQAALTRYWGPQYQSVAAADVVGNKSNAAQLDEERGGDYVRERIGSGLGAAILLGSFGGQGERSGFSSKDLKLACSRIGLNWAYTDGALLELENRCFYLHATSAGSLGKRYWFSTKPNLNRLVVQYRQQADRAALDGVILETLRTEVARLGSGEATWRVLVDPASELPEQRTLTLLILPPTASWDEVNGAADLVRRQVLTTSTQCGTRERIYRNTLLFLAPTARGLRRLRQALAERSALQAVRAEYGDQLDDPQKEDLSSRLAGAERAVTEALGPSYTIALRVRGNEVEHYTLPDARPTFREHLAYLWTTLVEEEEWILRKVGSVTLEKTGLIPGTGAIALKDAIEAFLRFTDKPMIASRQAVSDGLARACAEGVVGIGRGPTAANLHARACGEPLSLDASEEGVWVIPAFSREPVPGGTGAGAAGATAGPGAATAPTQTRSPPQAGKGLRRVRIRGSIPVESWSELFRCFVGPATKMTLARLTLGVNFELEARGEQPVDVNDPTLAGMREAARQLGLEFDVE